MEALAVTDDLRLWTMPYPVLAASCRFFETFSYLPPLSDAEISKQVRLWSVLARGFWPPIG